MLETSTEYQHFGAGVEYNQNKKLMEKYSYNCSGHRKKHKDLL